MSVIIGKGTVITVMETKLECPICTAAFDASEKIDKAKLPVFKTKCPECKGKIGISLPIFGGTTKCFEWKTPPHVKPVETVAQFEVNYINVKANL
ncbi:MAG: hypothetical protein IIC75_00325 [Bacteroidetes bacterium]|nr:hypothetical protein [Bacteroidota bacterium]